MIVNGKFFLLDKLAKRNILSLLDEFKLNRETVAIERNGNILDREDWDQVELEDSDKIEIIKFVGGG